MQQIVSFNYKPKPIKCLLSSFLFLVLFITETLLLLVGKSEIDNPLFHTIIVQIFLWLYIIVVGYLSLNHFIYFVFSLTFKRQIILDNSSIIVPKSIASFRTVKVDFSDIIDFIIKANLSERSLIINHRHGKIIIPTIVFDDSFSIHSLFAYLTDRVSTNRNE